MDIRAVDSDKSRLHEKPDKPGSQHNAVDE
jgi:hypothetical protein